MLEKESMQSLDTNFNYFEEPSDPVKKENQCNPWTLTSTTSKSQATQ